MKTPTDTLFSSQWYLQNSAVGEYDLNVRKVWDDYTGAGVKVMVIDNGFDHDHEDLIANYDATNDYDYYALDDDAAAAQSDDNHGTSVMGIIGAAKNGVGVVGTAFGSTMIGARIEYNVTADKWREQFTSAFADAVEKGVGVINMSFGGAGDYDTYDGVSNVALIKTAIEDAVTNGRDGLGIALVKSAGNSRGSNVDVNHNQSDSDTRQIIVSAVNRDGGVTTYSSYGAAVLISGFGSPSPGQIVTTDRRGADGYDASDYTTSFNGTSAAAPMISGVVALLEEANPNLGWRDIQTILAISARHVGSDVGGSVIGNELNTWSFTGATNWNGGGMHYSQDYGYGLVDALAAVRLAESWTAQSTSDNQSSASVTVLAGSSTPADGDLTGNTFTETMADDISVERVTVTLTFTANYAADMDVYLIGPDGREQRVVGDAGGNNSMSNGQFTFSAQGYRGISSQGDWSVRVVDDDSGGSVTVSNISVTVYGAEQSADDTYYYTNEFADFLDTHASTFSDTDGGVDTLNAAAVTAAISVDLLKGKGVIDGAAMRLSGVENVYGGDGGDTLIGGNSANMLTGARGNDLITGHKGQDNLSGGEGNDTFFFVNTLDSVVGKLRDLITDFTHRDEIDLTGVDAKKGGENDPFHFIRTDDFSDEKGELRYFEIDKPGSKHDQTVIEGDVTGDGHADFQIALTNLIKLNGGDFSL